MVKGQGVTSEVTFYYFEGNGRGDPLRQMFEYHGQPYKKVSYSFPDWETQKSQGKGGEFGGGLPQATYTENGVEQRLSQFGSILRHFGIRYGYYNPRNYQQAKYIDPVIDTFADVMGSLSLILFAAPEDQAAKIETYV